ncbi:hypothetical protein KR093_007915, partial [Drosophila rubida]
QDIVPMEQVSSMVSNGGGSVTMQRDDEYRNRIMKSNTKAAYKMTHLGASGMWPHAEVVNLTHKGVVAAPKWAQVAPLRVALRYATCCTLGATGRIRTAVITPRLMTVAQ